MKTWIIDVLSDGVSVHKEVFAGTFDNAVLRALILVGRYNANEYSIL